MGREDNVSVVLDRIMKYRIVNINGAPGFGKSALAINVGYHILKNNTSIRYINVADDLSAMDAEMMSNPVAAPSLNNDDCRIKKGFVHETKSLSEYKRSAALSISTLDEFKKPRKLIDELEDWSEEIQCTTVLILDNCDDILAFSRASHDNFIGLVKRLVFKSHLNLHIIVVSRERLLLTDHFYSLTVRGLNLEASVALLDKLAPAIPTDHLTAIAELLDGCPLALKVVGRLLHIYGESLTHSIKTEMMKVLDEPSDIMERFSVIMDMAFARLGKSKTCGYSLRFFPG